MKFGHLFEFHKIPDWYTEYVHYRELKVRIDEFKALKKIAQIDKLKGYYMINKQGQIYCIDFIKDFQPKTKNEKMSKQRQKSQLFLSEFGGSAGRSQLIPNTQQDATNQHVKLSHAERTTSANAIAAPQMIEEETKDEETGGKQRS